MKHEFLQHSASRVSKSASVPLKLQGAVVVEQMDWTRTAAGRADECCTGPGSDGAQVGERQRAKIWAPTCSCDGGQPAQLSKSWSAAGLALLGVRATMRRSEVEDDGSLARA